MGLLKILSLEDSINDFEIISEQLIKDGYKLNISCVDSESGFVKAISDETFDIILADYNLPQFDAFEALKFSQRICPDTPFICVSGSIGEITAIELIKHGATDYVLKDRLERLPFAVKRALDEAREKKELKEAEDALIKSEKKYRNIFENIQDVFYRTDIKGNILEISPSVKYFSEFTREELVGTSVYALYSDTTDRDSLITALKEKGEIRDYEIKIKSKGPVKEKYFSVNAKLEKDTEGNPFIINGSIRDINDRKHSEELLVINEAKLNDAQKLAKMGSWDFYLESNTYTWSENMFRMLHLQPFEVEPTYEDFINLVHPDDRLSIENYAQKILETKSTVSYEFRYFLAGNEIIWIQNIITPVFADDKLIELHGVNIDITEKKQFEQELIKEKENAQASDRLKTAFMNNISHEVRTPLNGILGFGHILLNPDLTAEEKELYYNMMIESSNRLLNTLTNIMDISVLTSGNQKVTKREIAPKQLVDHVCEKFSEPCKAKNTILNIVKNQDENDYTINTDENLAGKILFQLIDNAVKFTSKGSITVGYKKKESDLVFFVKDTGIGISDHYKKFIFKNFTQEDNDSTRKYEGTGIGLAIAQGFAKMLNGQIWMDSEKGKGTTCYFSLPLFGEPTTR
ncbi:MAG: ATP-binding protein [Prolixibacteraceae bacterium]